MNEELSKALTELIRDMKQSAGEASDFVVDQAPGVIQQLLLRDFVMSAILFGIFFILFLALTTILIVLIRHGGKWVENKAMQEHAKAKAAYQEALIAYEKEESWTRWAIGEDNHLTSEKFDRIKEDARSDRVRSGEYQAWLFVGYVVSVLGIIVSTIVCFTSTTWLQIWLAPKVYIIEYAGRFL